MVTPHHRIDDKPFWRLLSTYYVPGVEYSGDQCLKIWSYSGSHLETGSQDTCYPAPSIYAWEVGTPLFSEIGSQVGQAGFKIHCCQVSQPEFSHEEIKDSSQRWRKTMLRETVTWTDFLVMLSVSISLVLPHSTEIAAFAWARQSWVTDSSDKGQIFPHVIGGSNFPRQHQCSLKCVQKKLYFILTSKWILKIKKNQENMCFQVNGAKGMLHWKQ